MENICAAMIYMGEVTCSLVETEKNYGIAVFVTHVCLSVTAISTFVSIV